jgi:hypothetical protein
MVVGSEKAQQERKTVESQEGYDGSEKAQQRKRLKAALSAPESEYFSFTLLVWPTFYRYNSEKSMYAREHEKVRVQNIV